MIEAERLPEPIPTGRLSFRIPAQRLEGLDPQVDVPGLPGPVPSAAGPVQPVEGLAGSPGGEHPPGDLDRAPLRMTPQADGLDISVDVVASVRHLGEPAGQGEPLMVPAALRLRLRAGQPLDFGLQQPAQRLQAALAERIGEGRDDAVLDAVIVVPELSEDGGGQGLGPASRDPTPDPAPILDHLAVDVPDRTAAVVRPLEHLAGRVDEVGQEIPAHPWRPWRQIVDDGRTDLVDLASERGASFQSMNRPSRPSSLIRWARALTRLSSPAPAAKASCSFLAKLSSVDACSTSMVAKRSTPNPTRASWVISIVVRAMSPTAADSGRSD